MNNTYNRTFSQLTNRGSKLKQKPSPSYIETGDNMQKINLFLSSNFNQYMYCNSHDSQVNYGSESYNCERQKQIPISKRGKTPNGTKLARFTKLFILENKETILSRDRQRNNDLLQQRRHFLKRSYRPVNLKKPNRIILQNHYKSQSSKCGSYIGCDDEEPAQSIINESQNPHTLTQNSNISERKRANRNKTIEPKQLCLQLSDRQFDNCKLNQLQNITNGKVAFINRIKQNFIKKIEFVNKVYNNKDKIWKPDANFSLQGSKQQLNCFTKSKRDIKTPNNCNQNQLTIMNKGASNIFANQAVKTNLSIDIQNQTQSSSIRNKRNFISLVIKCKGGEMQNDENYLDIQNDSEVPKPNQITLSEDHSCTIFDVENGKTQNENNLENSKFKLKLAQHQNYRAKQEFNIVSPISTNENDICVKMDSKF